MATIGELMLLWDIRDELKRANDIVEEERLRRSEEELRRSDIEFKKRIVKQVREDDFSLLRRSAAIDSARTRIYPHITTEEEAKLIERGELLIEILYDKADNYKHLGFYAYWADETREEAQHSWYIERKQNWEKEKNKDERRVYRTLGFPFTPDGLKMS